jgi:RNA recognition motif-containing protein
MHMGKKLHVGNLGYNVTDADLSQLFAPHGTVESAVVIVDKGTGQGKGFGFVELATEAEAQTAIAALNGKEHDGRALMVSEARPRPAGGRGGSGGPRRY